MKDPQEAARIEYRRVKRSVVTIGVIVGLMAFAAMFLTGSYTRETAWGVVGGSALFISLGWGLHAIGFYNQVRVRRLKRAIDERDNRYSGDVGPRNERGHQKAKLPTAEAHAHCLNSSESRGANLGAVTTTCCAETTQNPVTVDRLSADLHPLINAPAPSRDRSN